MTRDNMATLILDVPLEAQTKSNTCWHAAASMIWFYWQKVGGRQGPMFTIVDHWVKNQAVSPEDFIVLARNVGLMEVPRSQQYSSDSLKSIIEEHGPVWCAGWWYGPGHVIVLAGVDGEAIHINDPDGGVRKKELVGWFNSKLANQLPGCLMCKDPGRY